MNTGNVMRADDARVACPLFQAEYGDSRPTSALQLHIGRVSTERALELNRRWHSRLPELVNHQICEAFAAEYGNVFYATAFWSAPVARLLNGRGMYELRRFAISPDAPKNTASRCLRIMASIIRRTHPEVTTLISYQDTEVHVGTIYKAAGWKATAINQNGEWNRPSRYRAPAQSAAAKVRWEFQIR